MLITANGQIMRTGLDQIRPIGRNTQGVRLIKLREGDKLVAAAKISPEEAKEQSDDSTIQKAELPPPEETEPGPEEVEEETAVEDEPEPQPASQKTKAPGKPKSAKPGKAPKMKRK
jgi:DNA gyrase subunit A